LTVEFDATEDPGVAPGQFAALYDGEECLGGGMIE
jgi:tRNA U34 2-thiouridine synthase MnmA/TrmU